MEFGIIGGGSWATALVKILADKKNKVHWWIRSEDNIRKIRETGYNPSYLKDAKLDTNYIDLSTDLAGIVKAADVLVVAVPSAYVESSLSVLSPDALAGKKVISAIKGLIPGKNILLNFYLQQQFGMKLEKYFAVLGPCHAEEVAAEKLSYLTFSGVDYRAASEIASQFSTPYINTIINHDILGVQYAAVLKNIYALGAGMAQGLGYGDNFLSVYIANAADEMASFLRRSGAEHIEVGVHDEDPYTHGKSVNYAASVYLGDLLVTCYSRFSRNRNFGRMIGEGKTVDETRHEMNMVAEGYHASKCIYALNQTVLAGIPIAETIYRILWEDVKAADGFKRIERVLV